MFNRCIYAQTSQRSVSAHFCGRLMSSWPKTPSQTIGKTNRSVIKYLLLGIPSAAIGYDGLFHQFQYSSGAFRFMRSIQIAALISADYSWSLFGIPEASVEYEEMLKRVHQRSADRLLAGCMANGGLYIKIGQEVSAINHILPKEYTETLTKLQDKCLTRSPNDLNRIFLQEFGQLPDQLYAEFNNEPIAAASLAQVYRATTKDGQQVAVKVQYIDLANRFTSDFGTICFLLGLVKTIHKNFNFTWILHDLRANLEQELDFLNEARNSEKCADDLSSKFDYIHVPKVNWDLTSTRILTAEWIDGFKVSDKTSLAASGINLKEVDWKIFNIFSEQIFNTGFVHADPHPGNVFVRKTKNNKAGIVLLDHGLYQTIAPETRIALCKFWECLVLKDVPGLRKYAKELNVYDYDTLAEILLQRPLNLVAPNFTTSLSNEDIKYMQEMAKQRLNTTLDTLHQMPRTMIFVVRNLNTIRAIARNHGDPIDRQAHMARYAQQCIFRDDKGWMSYLRLLFRRVRFEWHIFKSNLSMVCFGTKLQLLMLFNSNFDANALRPDGH